MFCPALPLFRMLRRVVRMSGIIDLVIILGKCLFVYKYNKLASALFWKRHILATEGRKQVFCRYWIPTKLERSDQVVAEHFNLSNHNLPNHSNKYMSVCGLSLYQVKRKGVKMSRKNSSLKSELVIQTKSTSDFHATNLFYFVWCYHASSNSSQIRNLQLL